MRGGGGVNEAVVRRWFRRDCNQRATSLYESICIASGDAVDAQTDLSLPRGRRHAYDRRFSLTSGRMPVTLGTGSRDRRGHSRYRVRSRSARTVSRCMCDANAEAPRDGLAMPLVFVRRLQVRVRIIPADNYSTEFARQSVARR